MDLSPFTYSVLLDFRQIIRLLTFDKISTVMTVSRDPIGIMSLKYEFLTLFVWVTGWTDASSERKEWTAQLSNY